jgi:calcineurin-like phosphoesterase family protein
MIYFTSDHHFGHTNIIRHCSRPFADADEMNREMTKRWNERVKNGDLVYHLGDFAFRGNNPAVYRAGLNGRIVLILGNHDKRKDVMRAGFETIYDMAQVSVDGTLLVLCHYAMRVWNKSHHGALHLYGHSHGTLPGTAQSLDVGVDCWDFRPVTLTEIKERLNAQRS